MANKTKNKKTDQQYSEVENKEVAKKPLNKLYLIPAVLLILAGLLFYFKGLFVAATVNGQPIARTTIISELEKQGGKRALESVITKTLIMQEANKRKITVSQKELDEEAAKIKKSIEAQGQSLDAMLAAQGMTKQDYINEVRLQKLLQKMVGEVKVTDAEIEKFMATNQQMMTEETNKEELKKNLRQSLEQEKLNQEYQKFIENLKKSAKINYFVTY